RRASWLARGPDASVVGLDDALADVKPEAGATRFVCPAAHELVEHPGKLVCGNPGTSIGDGDLHVAPVGGDADVDRRLRCRVLGCVVEKVGADLLNTLGIGAHPG